MLCLVRRRKAEGQREYLRDAVSEMPKLYELRAEFCTRMLEIGGIFCLFIVHLLAIYCPFIVHLIPIYVPFTGHLLATMGLLCNGFRTFLHGFRIKNTLFCLLWSEGFVGSVVEKYTDFSYFSLRFVNIFLYVLHLWLHHLGRRHVCRGVGTGQWLLGKGGAFLVHGGGIGMSLRSADGGEQIGHFLTRAIILRGSAGSVARGWLGGVHIALAKHQPHDVHLGEALVDGADGLVGRSGTPIENS